MYQFSYADVLNDSPKEARERERIAIDRSIEMLKAAAAKGPQSRESTEAVVFVTRLWSTLIEDLARPENELPTSLKADLISIGLFIMREAEKIRLEKSTDYQALIDVSVSISEGLK